MTLRFLPILLLAALAGAAYPRSGAVSIKTFPASHGASECDQDGISIGYDATFFENLTPSGYRVTEARVTGIDDRCMGHTIYVSLASGFDGLGDSGVQTITGNSMTLPLNPLPLASRVDAVHVEIDSEALPAPDDTSTPTPTPTVIPSPTPTHVPGVTVVTDPEGSPLPGCDPQVAGCGTSGNDSATVEDGAVILGPGEDTVDIVTSGNTDAVHVDAGPNDDVINLEVNAPSGSHQTIVIDGGSGDDLIAVTLGNAATDAVVDIVIRSGAGDDVILLPTSIPAGVSIHASSGRGNDRVLAAGPTIPVVGHIDDFFNHVLFPTRVLGGYDIRTGPGSDLVRGSTGPDTIFLGPGSDRANGGAGDDRLWGGAGNDLLNGGSGDDLLSGGAGRDELRGGLDRDELSGGQGNDLCYGVSDPDSISGCERERR